jgi:hypothetical protein
VWRTPGRNFRKVRPFGNWRCPVLAVHVILRLGHHGPLSRLLCSCIHRHSSCEKKSLEIFWTCPLISSAGHVASSSGGSGLKESESLPIHNFIGKNMAGEVSQVFLRCGGVGRTLVLDVSPRDTPRDVHARILGRLQASGCFLTGDWVRRTCLGK